MVLIWKIHCPAALEAPSKVTVLERLADALGKVYTPGGKLNPVRSEDAKALVDVRPAALLYLTPTVQS